MDNNKKTHRNKTPYATDKFSRERDVVNSNAVYLYYVYEIVNLQPLRAVEFIIDQTQNLSKIVYEQLFFVLRSHFCGTHGREIDDANESSFSFVRYSTHFVR